jgi:hypothetical protein
MRTEEDRLSINAAFVLEKADKKAQLVLYKGSVCVDCGGKFPQVCMGFDHVDPLTKSFSIGAAMGRSLDILKAEADKCDLVCANCHAVRTAGNLVVAKKISDAKRGKKIGPRRVPMTAATRLKKSESAKIKLHRGLSLHHRWHVNRGVVKEGCKFCASY